MDELAPRFRIYDLQNNPLTTEELHDRVYAWYDREYEAREAARFVKENRASFRNANPSDASWMRRSRGQRRRRA